MIAFVNRCSWCGAKNLPEGLQCRRCGHLSGDFYTPFKRTQPPLQFRRVLRQRYQMVKPIGLGGMGLIYEAVDSYYARRIAVKATRLSGLSVQQILTAASALRNEMHMLASLDHPNVPKVYDFFSESDRWYLVMDYIEGITLERYIQSVKQRSLAVEQVLGIGIQLCAVLDHLHTRPDPIIFRDLKPANIMSSFDGKLYLIDFGVARHVQPEQPQDDMPLGTVGYAAPEQYRRGHITPRSDIYSLGAILYQLLTRNDPRWRLPHLTLLSTSPYAYPVELVQLIARMVNPDAEKRPASAAQVKRELQNIALQMTRTFSGQVSSTR